MPNEGGLYSCPICGVEGQPVDGKVSFSCGNELQVDAKGVWRPIDQVEHVMASGARLQLHKCQTNLKVTKEVSKLLDQYGYCMDCATKRRCHQGLVLPKRIAQSCVCSCHTMGGAA